MFLRRPQPLLVILTAILVFTGPALACQVPVFRFALERWMADPYEITVAPGVSGEFSAEEKKALALLEAHQPGSGTNETGIFANLRLAVATEPVAESESALLRVAYPRQIRGYEVKPIWEGKLTLETARTLIDSPVRRELVKRLLSGESAVWVLVESGQPDLDDPSADLVEAALAKGEDTLKIPDGVMTRQEAESASNFASVNADDILQSHVPLKIDFSVLRVSREDPAEALFLAMLLNIEDDLRDYAEEPMVFPIFGRGRLLEPLIGRGINEVNTLDYATYICGACSCEVKDQNPGQDLIVAADWDAALEGSTVVIEKILPPLEGTGILAQIAGSDPGDSEDEVLPEEGEAVDDGPVESPGPSPRKFLVGPAVFVVVGLFLFIGIGTLVLLRKKTS